MFNGVDVTNVKLSKRVKLSYFDLIYGKLIYR